MNEILEKEAGIKIPRLYIFKLNVIFCRILFFFHKHYNKMSILNIIFENCGLKSFLLG